MTSVSVIVNFHREGLFAGPSITSLEDALAAAKSAGICVDVILVLDRPDDITRNVVSQAARWPHTLHETDLGDPGLARNFGVERATGEYVTFLDGDDLWGDNWLVQATTFCAAQRTTVIAHSAINVIYGADQFVWVHTDSTAPATDLAYLEIANYWDAMSFGKRQIYRNFPFVKNDLRRGYGHEDWHWNCQTILAGLPHRPVPGTVHFKRRRLGSQSDVANRSDVIPWPSGVEKGAVARRG